MSNIGLPEIAIVLVIVLVIFGPKRLPQLGRSLGSGMREFKDAVTGKSKDDDEHDAIEAPQQPVQQPVQAQQPQPQPVPAERVTPATAPTEETPSTANAADAS